jgi:hypothetical protein
MNEKICPQCHYPQMKTWQELSDEQKMLAERLPLSASLTIEQRKKNLFCPCCWFEQTANFNEFC